MEPFRPWVDWLVYCMVDRGEVLEVSRQTKQHLLGLLSTDVLFGGKKMPLMVAAHSLAATCKRALTDREESLLYPQRILMQPVSP